MQDSYCIVPNRMIRRFMERHHCTEEEAKEILLKDNKFFPKKKRQYNKKTIKM